MSIVQAIKTEARRLGFTLAGVTTPNPPPHVSAYENWLQLGRHGSMDYLANERARKCRRDPRVLLPECRSILMLGVRYPDPKTAGAGGRERICAGRLPPMPGGGITIWSSQNG